MRHAVTLRRSGIAGKKRLTRLAIPCLHSTTAQCSAHGMTRKPKCDHPAPSWRRGCLCGHVWPSSATTAREIQQPAPLFRTFLCGGRPALGVPPAIALVGAPRLAGERDTDDGGGVELGRGGGSPSKPAAAATPF